MTDEVKKLREELDELRLRLDNLMAVVVALKASDDALGRALASLERNLVLNA